MDKAAFEIIGNVGSVEIKAIKGGQKLAVLSVATSERWKRDNGSNGGDWAEKTLWHRVAVFGGPPPRGDSRADKQNHVERIEAQVQKGTRVRRAKTTLGPGAAFQLVVRHVKLPPRRHEELPPP